MDPEIAKTEEKTNAAGAFAPARFGVSLVLRLKQARERTGTAMKTTTKKTV